MLNITPRPRLNGEIDRGAGGDDGLVSGWIKNHGVIIIGEEILIWYNEYKSRHQVK